MKTENTSEKIVVYRSYDTAIMANLAKTKLDVNGIPCFLTDEHLMNLYPLRNSVFPGVRLHVFENDLGRVTEILEETFLPTLRPICPACKGSDFETHVVPESFLKLLSRILWVIVGSIFIVLVPAKAQKTTIVHRCRSCYHEF